MQSRMASKDPYTASSTTANKGFHIVAEILKAAAISSFGVDQRLHSTGPVVNR